MTFVTNQDGEKVGRGDLRISRRPPFYRLVKEYRSAEAVILQGPTLRLGWPLIWLPRRRALMVHHMPAAIRGHALSSGLSSQLARRVHHAAVSRALARMLPWTVEAVLPNPYDDCIFRIDSPTNRTRDILFVGRLIPEKGAADLLMAVSQLRRLGNQLTLTVVGAGPDRARLEQIIATHQLKTSVQFTGQLTGQALARSFQQHRIVAIPSLQQEGFGIVALEAIACGCAVVGSRSGGLPEAIGPCGVTYPPGDIAALIEMLSRLLHSEDMSEGSRARADQHLAKHRPSVVAKRYFRLLHECAGNSISKLPDEDSERLRIEADQSSRCASL